jgi:hypothetical protein
MDSHPDTVRSRICKTYPEAIARHYSRADVPHEAARADANHRHGAALARIKAATYIVISDTVVDADAYPGVATVVYAGCVPNLPLVPPPKSADKRTAPATRFFSFAHGEPTAWTWAADVAERLTTHVGPDLAPVQLLNQLLRGFLRRAEELRDTTKTKSDYSLGWIHVIVEGAMRNDVMMMLLLLSADEPRARVALSDDECLFIPHLVGDAKMCTSIVYRSMYIDGCAEIRYLDPVRIELKSDSIGFEGIESADTEKTSSVDDLVALVKNAAANTRGNFSTHNTASDATAGVAQHPGATYSPADVFLCDAAAIRPLRIADTQKGSAHTVPAVKPGEIYAGLFGATGVLRRFYAMAYYASYLSGSARKSLRTLAAVLETNGVRIEPAVVPSLPHFAPAARSFEPIVDAYGSDGKEKIRNGAVAVRMTDLPPPITFSADGVVRYCYPVCRLGRYTDSSDFAYAALRRGKIASRVYRTTANTAGNVIGGPGGVNDPADSDTDDDDDNVIIEPVGVTTPADDAATRGAITSANEAATRARAAATSASKKRAELLGLRSDILTIETNILQDAYSTGVPSVKRAYLAWVKAKPVNAETAIKRGLASIEIAEKAAAKAEKYSEDAKSSANDIISVKVSQAGAERNERSARAAARDVDENTGTSNGLVDTFKTATEDLLAISAAVDDAAVYSQKAGEYALGLEELLHRWDSDLAGVRKRIVELTAKQKKAQEKSDDALKKSESAQKEKEEMKNAAVFAIQAAAAAEAKMYAMKSNTEKERNELPVDAEDTECTESLEVVQDAQDAANTESEEAQRKAANAASVAVSEQEQAIVMKTAKEAVDAALDVFGQIENTANARYGTFKAYNKEVEDAVNSIGNIVYSAKNSLMSAKDAKETLNAIKNLAEDIVAVKVQNAYAEWEAYSTTKNSEIEKINWDMLELVKPDTISLPDDMRHKIHLRALKAMTETTFGLANTVTVAREAAMKKAGETALAAAKRQASASLPSVQYSDRFFAWGHRYACVVLSALPGAPLPLPRIAAHYLYLRTVCAARELVTPDEVRQLHAAFGKATRHPEHAMREFDRLAATHTAIQVAYEGILAPLLIRTVVDPRVSRCVRVRAGDNYGSDYAPYIGLFEFGPTAEPSTSDWPGRKVRIRLSRESALGTRLDEMVSLLLLDANPDVDWTKSDTVFAAIRAHHMLLRDADWFLPIADGMRAGLSKTVVGTWRLRLHFEKQAEAEAYATGLVGRLKTRSDYIVAGAESVTLLLGGQAVGVAITMDPVVRETRAE